MAAVFASAGPFRAAIEALFPLECLACGKDGAYCCQACLAAIAVLEGRDALSAPAGTDIRVAYAYGRPIVRRLIADWKYEGYSAAEPAIIGLIDAWYRAFSLALPSSDAVVPVPLHPAKLRRRGFNQSERLAAAVAERSGFPLAPSGALVRRRDTPPQAERADAADRGDNVRGAFSASPRAFRGKTVLIVDDVCTSGATIAECAAALKAAGAVRIHAFALAGALQRGQKPLK
jgi:ComF family protein